MRKRNMRKIFACFVCVCMAVALCACSPGGGASSGKSNDPQDVSIGDEIEVSTAKGDYNLTVDGVDVYDPSKGEVSKFGSFGDKQPFGILFLTVQNVSYNDSSEGDSIALGSDVYVTDPDGVTLNFSNGAFQVGKYDAAAGGYVTQVKQGQTKSVAIFISVDLPLEGVTVHAGNSAVAIDSSSFGEPTGKKSTSTSSENSDLQNANLGDSIAVSTNKGDYNVVVNGFSTSKKMTEEKARQDGSSEGEAIGLLLLTVENVSYNDTDITDSIELEPDVSVVDSEGVTLHAEDWSLDYGKYDGAAGGYAHNVKQGQTKRVAVFYSVDASETTVDVVVGNSIIKAVPVAADK